jgi:dTDP-4-dehydrorhamnose 3,5-epimerase
VKFTSQSIADVILIEPTVHDDGRGYFMESFKQDVFEETIGYKVNFVQDNESKSNRGVLRGLHYQLPPYAQAKLVRVIEGSVLDVAVDIRKSSPTFGQHVAVELTGNNKNQLFVPCGFAHGFVVLSDSATFAYKVDNYYAPKYDQGIRFNDKQLDINWKLPNQILQLSEKDQNLPLLNQIKSSF